MSFSNLRNMDIAEYDHIDLPIVVEEISKLSPSKQNNLIHDSLGVKGYNFDRLIEYIRQQFYILYQEDEEGPYSALVFGNMVLSVTTWDGHDVFPRDLDETYYTDEWLEDEETLRCEHLLLFIEFWTDYYKTTLEDFLSGLQKIAN